MKKSRPLSLLRCSLALLGALAAAVASATTYDVNSISSLQSAINGAVAGDLILVQNGVYTTTGAITVNRTGTAANPIVIAAATVGGVEIKGTAGFAFASPAAYVYVEGFKFTHAAAISIPAGTSHCRLTRNIIELTIPAGTTTSYVNIAGDDVEIDRNELRNKSTLGEMLDISGSGSQVAQRLWVHHNYFHDFSNAGGNGAETIRWGLSGLSLSTGAGLCEYNLFVNCVGENELISNKSSGNTYRYNTLLDSPGNQLSQRHGNNNLIYGNYLRNTAGIRIYGDHNQIFSNYLESNSQAIDIGNGDGEVENGAALTSHDKPDFTVISFNTLINNTIQYQMEGRTGGLGAANTTFANNLIQGGGQAASISTSAPYASPVWQGNIIWNTTAGAMPSGTYTTVDPLLALDANGVYHLQSGSPAIGAAVGTYSGVTVDQDGQPRPSTGKDVGADEVSTAPVIARMLTPADVGPNSGGAVAAPTFNPVAGTYTGGQSVTISSTTSGATIHYTTDGSTPSSTVGSVYSGPVAISTNTTLKAIASAAMLDDSAVTTGVYNIQVSAPSFTPGAGTYNNNQSVTITSATGGASIRYTTDGSTPSSTVGTVYSAPVAVNATTTLKAIAYQTGLTDSAIASGTFTLAAATPAFSPVAGTYSTGQSVTLTTATTGATIRYTTDGSTPSSTVGTVYSGAISVAATTTLKAIAYQTRYSSSAVATAVYTITLPQVAAPTFSPTGGSYTSVQNVAISTTTGGASIRYTTDGSTPTSTTGTVYAGPVAIGATTTLKAIAYASGMTDSSVSSATYTITLGGTTVTSASGFVNQALSAAQTGTFTAQFDASSSVSPANAVVGLSSGAATAYTSIAVMVRFNTTGTIDARNGGAFTTGTVPFAAGTIYHFRLVVTVPTHTYSAYVTAPGGAEQTLGTGLAFRTEQAGVANLDTWNFDVNATPGGSLTVNNLAVAAQQQVAAPTFSPAGGSYTGAQSVTISSTTSGASIRYTTDGSTPTATTGTVYSGAVAVASTTTLKAIAYKSGLTDSTVSSATYTIAPASITVAVADGFYNTPMASSQTGTFTASFDAVPSLSPSNTTIGLCKGTQTAYTGLACAVRFNTLGDIDARNAGAYAAASTIPFSAGVSYHFRLVVNVSAHTYSIYVTPAGGSELTVGLNYAFRTEQNIVTSLDTWNIDVNATPGGSVTVSNLTSR